MVIGGGSTQNYTALLLMLAACAIVAWQREE